MNCPKCGSDNVNIVSEQDKIKTNNKGCLVGLGRLILITCTLGLWLLVPSRKYNSKVKNRTVGICQSCGYKFKV
ncbi:MULTISPECIES: hypothetical protein [Clostridium]|uniref:hypothetical protein n=1 Tax=Clostridium TaxID=1485 RepID=UPI0007730EA4|nr:MULTISPECIES: hypothetical protein [Clostridium]AUM96324.1 hypothetical protein RSJ11_14695 [Clostridium sporogenes]AVQ53779.1 hypothetical protein C7M59_13295 [Clostridium botulinum]